MHIALDGRTETQGSILREHIKSIDKTARKIKKIKTVPTDILEHVIAMINGELEIEA